MNIKEIIRKRFPNERTQDLANELGLTYSQVANRAFTMGLKKSQEFKQSDLSGRANLIKGGKTFQFKPGHTPANKGTKMSPELYEKVKESMFKKGNRPDNWKPDGSIVERNDKTGRIYLYYKIKDSYWIPYHHKVWRDANGPIPPKHVVSFKDGNSRNCDISNLELMTMCENAKRNSIHRFPQEIQEVIKLKAKLKRKINGKKQNQ
jgi:hypothetical protein